MTPEAVQVRTAPSEYFDLSFFQEALQRKHLLERRMLTAGFNVSELHSKAENVAERVEAKKVFDTIGHAATVMFLQWNASRNANDYLTQHAAAVHFNKLTFTARKLNKNSELVAQLEITELTRAIKDDIVNESTRPDGEYNPFPLAKALAKAARARNHENAWSWTVLPTYRNQSYGRILLDTAESERSPYKVFLTQPIFIDGESTLFHTHGNRWSLSAPLGEPGTNRHRNTLWRPGSSEQPFPLEQKDNAYYAAGDVTVIRPMAMHGIEGARDQLPALAIDEFAELPKDAQSALLAKAKFGELASLHIYRADKTLSQEFAQSPVVIDGAADAQFFQRNDMIIWDHRTRTIRAASGGAWEQRMETYGATGEHCGKCFMVENSPQDRLTDPHIIYRLFKDQPEGALLYSAAQLAEK